MAFRRGRPEVWYTEKLFNGSHALLHWAYRIPMHNEKAPARNDFYTAVHTVLAPENRDPRVLEHLQVETFKQWAQQTRGVDRQGRPRLRHPMAARALICDGSFAQGQALQTPITKGEPGDEDEHRQIRIRHRRDRDGIEFVTYGADGKFTRSVVGYKLVALVCPIGGRAVITTLAPSKMSESDSVLYLLERLFELWPECPTEYLVGDGLFGHSLDFLRELLFRFGIDPVFPWRADYPSDIGIKGVPVCHCTGKPRPMRLLQRKGKWWGPSQRLAGNLPRGKWVPTDDLRVRYEYCCPEADAHGKSGGCKNQTTYPWDDPRIYTYLPHTAVRDTHATKYNRRRVLLAQRNIIESFYSALQRHGMQGRGVERPEWANDVEVNWMLGLGALFLTARRLVFENGLYERAKDEAKTLHLLNASTRENLSHGPTREELDAADEVRVSELGPIAPPESWVRARGNHIDPLTGSGQQWAEECRIRLAQPPSIGPAAGPDTPVETASPSETLATEPAA
ncbi:MAG: hypothetical protein ACRDK4_00235 [Solirubrobacteraceae bacterium]